MLVKNEVCNPFKIERIARRNAEVLIVDMQNLVSTIEDYVYCLFPDIFHRGIHVEPVLVTYCLHLPEYPVVFVMADRSYATVSYAEVFVREYLFHVDAVSRHYRLTRDVQD